MVLLAFSPAWLNPFTITLLNYIGIYALVALGLVLLTGVGGMVSFGQAAFVGIGGLLHRLAHDDLRGLALARPAAGARGDGCASRCC